MSAIEQMDPAEFYDALRCAHLVDARDQLCSAVIRALVKAEKLKK